MDVIERVLKECYTVQVKVGAWSVVRSNINRVGIPDGNFAQTISSWWVIFPGFFINNVKFINNYFLFVANHDVASTVSTIPTKVSSIMGREKFSWLDGIVHFCFTCQYNIRCDCSCLQLRFLNCLWVYYKSIPIRVYMWRKIAGGSTWEFRSMHLVTLGIWLVSWAAASQRWIFWKVWRWDNICENWIITGYSSQCIKAIFDTFKLKLYAW